MNEAKAEAFANRLAGAINEASVVMMTSIGHRTGLFDAMENAGALTSSDLATKAGLNERYVREWLGAMASGGVVDHDETKMTFTLPSEHAASLTRAAAPANIAVTAQWVPLLAAVEDEVVECFFKGGGVPYSSYPRFHEVMAEESDQTVGAMLVGTILPVVDGLPEKLASGIEVMDIGCGSGRALNLMAETFPASRFSGYDFSAEGVARANEDAQSRGLSNASFEVIDAAEVSDRERFDLVTAFDAIHDQIKPRAVLANIHRALRPGGTFLMQDIGMSSRVHENRDHVFGPFLYTISCMHCMTVSLSAGGEGLGAAWGEHKARELLAEAGFAEVEVKTLPHDPLNYYYVCDR